VGDLLSYFVEATTHKALYGSNGILRIGDRLALGRITYFTLSILEKSYNGGRSATAFIVSDYDGFIALHYRDATVSGTQIDSNYFSHVDIILKIHNLLGNCHAVLHKCAILSV
jgi:hypothetical protein